MGSYALRRSSSITNTLRSTSYLDSEGELVFYCPECAEREFGER
jgi:hypothetical protein